MILTVENSTSAITAKEKETGRRNLLQHELLKLCLADGSWVESDIETMQKIFKQVSDIIDNIVDNEDPQNEVINESIRTAYQAGDFQAAAEMLKTVIKF